MAGPLYTRRQILAAGAAGGLTSLAAAALAKSGLATVAAAAATRPAGADLGAVEHVVFLMHENRSFDHYFGTYKAVRGFNDHAKGSTGVFAQAWPGGSTSTVLPYRLNSFTKQAECTLDLNHFWPAQHASWNNGAMDRFVATHTSSAFEGANGVMTMGYYTRADLPFYYALADAFTICDHYHCSVLGPTHPNRLFHVSGTNDPDGVAGGPVLITSGKASVQFTASWETMPERLSAKGVPWKVYNPFGAAYRPGNPLFGSVSDNVLFYFKQFADPTTSLNQNAFGYTGINVAGGFTDGTGPNDFGHDVATNQLPAVSWIIPPVGYDEHPPAPPALGEWYTSQILSTLLSNPAVWSKTVLFITWDENDGFFDHVAPPTAPAGTPGEYLSVDPLPPEAGGIAGPIGLGMRVPMLVVSPFSSGGYLCPDVFDHTSQLRFLETLFGVPVPNLSDWRRSVTGDLTATLSHGAVLSRPRLPVTSSSTKKKPILGECSNAQILEASPGTVDLSPKRQTMPTQEHGMLKPTTG
jgi:phospholipase C